MSSLRSRVAAGVLGAGVLAVSLLGPAPAGQARPARTSLTIALVRQLCTGDFFAQWLTGAQAEASALHISLNTSCASGNDAQMVSNGRTAITQGVQGIIFDHGLAQPMAPVVAQALRSNIPVVTFDLETTDTRVTTIDQNDLQLGLQITDAMIADVNGKANVGLAHVGGFLPLDKRKSQWDTVQRFFPGMHQVATWGTVSAATVAAVQNQTVAALTAHPEMSAILAPYDAFALGATNAVAQAHRSVRIYGADISTADIQVMTRPGSPWVATSATDPATVGATAVRAIALKALHRTVPTYVEVNPALVTQSFLRSHHIRNMEDLRRVLPAFAAGDTLPRP